MTQAVSHASIAIAALVLGILSLLLSFFVVGALFGLIGLIFGAVYLKRYRKEPRGVAIGGLVLSALGLAGGVAFGAFYFFTFTALRDYVTMTSGSTDELMAWEGAALPAVELTTLDGQVLRLNELEGRRIVVNLWATWCTPCIREVPHYNRLVDEHSADELVVIGISRESREIIEPFVAQYGVRYPIVSAGDLPAPFSSAPGLPTTFIIDENGVIDSVLLGYRDFDALANHVLAR
ncbi:MAG: TlpA disulfide reductase family protein [Gammaproteobacteria bacterium]|nr:TlpA disulfide reductase family protein [Gammaproteobacteria bacterium]